MPDSVLMSRPTYWRQVSCSARSTERKREREREVSVCVRTFDTIAAPSSFDFSQLSVNGSRIEATSAAFSVWLSSLLLSKVLRFGLLLSEAKASQHHRLTFEVKGVRLSVSQSSVATSDGQIGQRCHA